jgi:hypothetical protein
MGWRELDDATLVARAHALLVGHISGAEPDLEGLAVMSVHADSALRSKRVQKGRGAHGLEPSDAAFRAAWARLQARSTPQDEPDSEDAGTAPTSKGPRYPGWLLTASLTLAALQLLMLLVAFEPTEMIKVVQRSFHEWKSPPQGPSSETNQVPADAVPQDDSVTKNLALDPAQWWQSSQQAGQRSHRADQALRP